jgi:hypothetical protein
MQETVVNQDLPDWFLEHYPDLKAFLDLSDEDRARFVVGAAGLFGTVISSLTQEGWLACRENGERFFLMNKESIDSPRLEMTDVELLYMMLGIATECMGIQQMKIETKAETK